MCAATAFGLAVHTGFSPAAHRINGTRSTPQLNEGNPSRSVLVLTALILTLDHCIGRYMGKTNRAICFIDVLPTSTTCSVSIFANVFILNVDID